MEALTDNEPLIRFVAFFGVFAVMALWEMLAPRRRDVARAGRWLSNLGIVVLNSVVLRLIFPAAAVGIALYAEARGIGLFNLVELPLWLVIVLAFLVLDFAVWLQHRVMHAVPVLWRLHRMHHADTGFDVTTGLRFHPIEIILSMLWKGVVIFALGAPAVAVLVFEVALNATSMFNHGNVRLPLAIDRVLRLVVVTPDMHRVHHSTWRPETDSNFGFNLPWWDRLFRTYRAQPRDGHETMTIGLNTFRTPRDGRLDRLLIQPFIGPARDQDG
jgi:sterol desaturase/sphingolipid hydroxylase (fatty acid hydroxylase superfamily)